MRDYLSVHVRELIVVAPDNLHADLPDPEESWFAVFAARSEARGVGKFEDALRGLCFCQQQMFMQDIHASSVNVTL